MIELIKYDNPDRWNSIVDGFLRSDVYYRCEYATSFMNNEDGIPYLLYYQSEKSRLCYPVVEKDIADFSGFRGNLERGHFFDWNTPYGYGGPLSDVDELDIDEQAQFIEELYELAKSRNVVSQFIRFHPLLQNQKVCNEVIENVYIKDTIYIDLITSDDLMQQMDSKNRNLIRKAIKSDIVIVHDKGQLYKEFMKIYEATMNRDEARDFYYFPESYYQFINEEMSKETEYFYAFKDENMVAASMFFYDEKVMHYHLSGNYVEYRTFAPTNLLIYAAANWGREQGCTALHLGGGIGVEDSLFHFKKQFNKNGRVNFYIGRTVFEKGKYDELLRKRKDINENFDMNNSYYIQYRKPE